MAPSPFSKELPMSMLAVLLLLIWLRVCNIESYTKYKVLKTSEDDLKIDLRWNLILYVIIAVIVFVGM